jgi:hypothetical protein
MPTFTLHIGFELPFWLAAHEGDYDVMIHGSRHHVSVNNSVNRLEIGDFYLGTQAKGVVWCHEADGESTREKLQLDNPNFPVTRHPLNTVVTHVRGVEAPNKRAIPKLYEEEKRSWVAESLEVVNRFLEAYSIAAFDDKTRGEVGRVAFWDVGFVVVSFWDEGGKRQLWGHIEAVRSKTARPLPFDAKRQQALELLVMNEVEYPLDRVLSASAWAHLQRGNYRAAIVDDFNAIEVAVSEYARELAARRNVPKKDLDSIFKRLRFEGICDLLPVLGGMKIKDWDKWHLLKTAQRIRNKVVHRGARATSADARTVHDAATWTLTYAVVWLANLESSDGHGGKLA